jgi:hypothetical protein
MLFERAENTNVGEAFHSAAAQNERDALASTAAGLLYHRRLPSSINTFSSMSLQVLIQSIEPNDRTADHENVARVAANDGSHEKRRATHDHQRLALTEPGAAALLRLRRRRNNVPYAHGEGGDGGTHLRLHYVNWGEIRCDRSCGK